MDNNQTLTKNSDNTNTNSKNNSQTNQDSSAASERPKSLNNSSPTKQKHGNNDNSPTKGKNKKKNDARRKNNKKQQEAPTVTNNSEKQQQSRRSKSPSTPILDKDASPISVTNDQQTESTTQQIGTKLPTKESSINSTSNISNNSNNTNLIQIKDSKKTENELKVVKEQLISQNNLLKNLLEQIEQQQNKTKELSDTLLNTRRTCNELENLLQQELASRSRLERENGSLEQNVIKLKNQISILEKNKSNDDELKRVLSATLMERETEVSLLKLKLTRLQTNPKSIQGFNSGVSGSISSIKQQQQLTTDPCQTFTSSGRSNSEFDRSSYVRSTMRAEQVSVRASTSHLRSTDEDASVWATVPEELTPSKRPLLLERSLQSIYADSSIASYNPYGNLHSFTESNQFSTPITRDRRYKTLPKFIKSPSQYENDDDDQKSSKRDELKEEPSICPPQRSEMNCKVTNLDDSNSTSSGGNRTINSKNFSFDKSNITKSNEPTISKDNEIIEEKKEALVESKSQNNYNIDNSTHYSTIETIDVSENQTYMTNGKQPPSLPDRIPTTPVKSSSGFLKLFGKFRRSDSSTSNSRSKTDLNQTPVVTPNPSPFKRNAARSTMVGAPKDIRAQISPIHKQSINFQTDKPFAEWDTDMLVDWLTTIGLSMYTTQCRRWVKCGAHIMNATPAEVDKGLGITNHLHRKKLRLAISELNGDCDKITKAAAKLDYLWVARWLDDMGLPQYKEAFINARVDGRVLNYLTVEDLVSMGVKSVLHHASIRCGIRVLRSIKFDLQQLKRRATAEEIERMSSMRQQMDQNSGSNNKSTTSISQEDTFYYAKDIALWTCHRVMEWLRMIDFAEFAPNLRGSGVHGGLIVFEDGFNIDTMCSLLSIPLSRTLLRRHLATFFKELIGNQLAQRKRQYQDVSSNQQLNPLAEIKLAKKSLWFTKLKSSKVGQDNDTDEYLCPMYPVEHEIIKTQEQRKNSTIPRELDRIPESINV